MNDVIKGVIYDRGEAVLNGETKYLSLVAMVIASDKPLVTTHREFVVMGEANVSEEIRKLASYKCQYQYGDISNGIVAVSTLSPDDLIGLDEDDFEYD